MKNKSIQLNIVLNCIKTALSILFPLITFKYASSILGIANIGKITFSQSVVSCFLLFAGLGFSSYAAREGARIRTQPEKISAFSSEIFTLNLISTAVSYLFLAVAIISIPLLNNYRSLILILSTTILFTTIGADWVNVIFEDYLYITVRSILVQVLALILLFLFVKSSDDLIIYVVLIAFSQIAANIINFFYIRKYVSIRPGWCICLRKHLKPILIIFSMNLAITLYVNSDNLMLGYFANDVSLGYYSVAVKVYFAIKTLIVAAIAVLVPRLASIVDNDREKYLSALKKILHTTIIFAMPISVGLFLFSREFVLMVSGASYLEAVPALKILSAAVFFSEIAYVINGSVLLVMRKEKLSLLNTVVGALLNIGLNFYAIPHFAQNGAAVTTLIAEISVCCMGLFSIRRLLRQIGLSTIIHNLLQCVFSCVVLTIICLFFKAVIANTWIGFAISAILGAAAYFFSLFLFRNSTVIAATVALKNEVKKRTQGKQ